MDEKLTSLTSRVIAVENEITSVKTRVSDLETSSQGTSNLFDEIKETTFSETVNISELNVFVNVHFIVQEISQ
jgi:hypothetical protein